MPRAKAVRGIRIDGWLILAVLVVPDHCTLVLALGALLESAIFHNICILAVMVPQMDRLRSIGADIQTAKGSATAEVLHVFTLSWSDRNRLQR
jgi:hypothetical protein